MRPRPRYLGPLIAVVAILALTGCGNDTGGSRQEGPPQEASGVISRVDPAQGPVEEFALETVRDGTLEIRIADDVDYGFDLDHLREHMDTADPVTVELETRDGTLYALSIEDVVP